MAQAASRSRNLLLVATVVALMITQVLSGMVAADSQAPVMASGVLTQDDGSNTINISVTNNQKARMAGFEIMAPLPAGGTLLAASPPSAFT